MHYNQTTLILPIAPTNLYTLHQSVESLVRTAYLGDAAESVLRNEMDAVPQYAYRAVMRDEQSSIIMIRSRQSIGLPDERTRDINFSIDDRLKFQYFPCVTSKRNGRSILLSNDEIPEKVIAPGLLKSGLEPLSIHVKGVDLLSCNKPRNRPFYLAGAHTTVDARIMCADAAMDAFVYGIGRKTVFGFGLMLNIETA